MRINILFSWAAAVILPILTALPIPSAWAAFGEDLEKPKPEFTRKGEVWTARLIPRGKSTSVQIDFEAGAGKVDAIEAVDFAAGEEPALDVKDFRSGFFKVRLIAVAPGADTTLAMACAYFNSSTQLWGGDPRKRDSWKNFKADNKSLADRVNALTIAVRDGGPLDADGIADGAVEIYVGPHDSFWGYAMGTLFIRFFGVFIVLGVLQTGMLISGAIFHAMETRRQNSTTATTFPEEVMETISTPAEEVCERPAAPTAIPAVAPDVAAAIALALYLYDESEKRRNTSPGMPTPVSGNTANSAPWSMFGRSTLMTDRLRIFDRFHFQPVRTSK